jgi:hypothetical protein
MASWIWRNGANWEMPVNKGDCYSAIQYGVENG